MNFEFPDEPENLIDALRDAEMGAPAEIRPLLIQAANKLAQWNRAAQDATEDLARIEVGTRGDRRIVSAIIDRLNSLRG